ncbi:MAG: ABC transporter ATP-binding protein [Saprospiraceae bacterium]|nr:ABC transporter ATP-binding protein [Saprospiraceae bacterium]
MTFTDKNIILRILNLSISSTGRGAPTIIDNLSIDIERSKITSLLGESGSGKTLTALSIPGLTKYFQNISISGKILFKEAKGWTDIFSLSEKEMTDYRGKRIALIMQDPLSSFDPNKKCGKQLHEVIRTHKTICAKETQDYILSLLQKMKLEPRVLNSYPHQLSGGELQRFSIAIAVSSNPELIIADEPTTNLDANLKGEILNLIKDINREKAISFLFISHDLKAVKAISDNICLIKNGKLLEYKKSIDFFNDPSDPLSRSLIDAFFNFSLNQSIASPDHPLIEVLDVRDISKSFGTSVSISFFQNSARIEALKNISFRIDQGETIGIIGESGSGKSTIARILVQLEHPDKGSVTLSGKNIFLAHKRDRKNIQMVFQNPVTSLNKIIKISKLLKEPYETDISKENTEDIPDLNDLKIQLGINDILLERYPDSISGGEAQRIALARALAYNPKLIVMDESLSALDKISQNEILKLLNDIKQKRNTSFIFITHDLSLARHFCDRILIMKDGRIIEQGATTDIFNSPVQHYTKSLLNAIY